MRSLRSVMLAVSAVLLATSCSSQAPSAATSPPRPGKRRYWIGTAASTGAMLILAVIWAITEYHNAGGWPTQGFSQSSGIPDVWNIWIIYPAMAWLFLTAVGGLIAYLRKPISESQIRREIERQNRS